MENEEELIAFLASRAFDPYSGDEASKTTYLKRLCTKIEDSSDTASLTVRLLTHRMLSPDQNEASAALNAFDFVVKNGSQPVFEELNKLQTLNAFIQLLSPENQGQQTSAANKEKAISMLFEWQSLPVNTENISKIYSMLRSRKIIASEPKVSVYQFKSKKGFGVETERKDLGETSDSDSKGTEFIRLKAQLLNDLFDTIEVGQKLKNENLTRELFGKLINVRPFLFHLVVKTTDGQEQEMVDILSLNDTLNSIIQRYNNEFPGNRVTRQESGGVRFHPESIKEDKAVSSIHRKATPHSRSSLFFDSEAL